MPRIPPPPPPPLPPPLPQVIKQLNGFYRGVALWLTANENHRTDADFEGALVSSHMTKSSFFFFFKYLLPLAPPKLRYVSPFSPPALALHLAVPLSSATCALWLLPEQVLKRFFFEAFDCFLPLFYLAFVQFDVVRLTRWPFMWRCAPASKTNWAPPYLHGTK